MSLETAALVAVLRRDQAVVIAGLVAVSAISWGYILTDAGMVMGDMPAAGMMAMPAQWSAVYAVLMLAMWWVMMVAMMLPSAAPMLLLFAALMGKDRKRGGVYIPTWIFATGYLVAWGGFSLAAVALQWGLERLMLLSPMMAATSVTLGGSLLIGAGVYQLTPLKQACLRHCRSPVAYLAHNWPSGPGAAFAMGCATACSASAAVGCSCCCCSTAAS
jgi:predicted metal-binding membrane protein